MGKKVGIVLIGLIIVAAAFYAFYEQSDGESQITLYGNVDIRQVSLAFTQSDRIETVNAEEGDAVKAGDVIATLDNTIYRLKLQQSEAQIAAQQALVDKLNAGPRKQEVAQATAVVNQLNANVNIAQARLKRLLSVESKTQGQGVSAQDIDEAKDNVTAATAALDKAKANADLVKEGPRKEDILQAKAQLGVLQSQGDLLKEQLARTQLIAPSDGVVRARLLEPGDIASPVKPVVSLALTSPKWIRVYINEVQLASVNVGDQARITVDGLATALAGTVTFISSVAEFTPKNVETEDLRTSLVYEMRVRVADDDNRLKLGMPATVVFPLGD
ncbi:HlyD family efflux transporter periplasmic adaptor subunit [Alteromonas sp. C1M14]|uniref:HlyD family efflux transporter periplasmic adaptor subunit n=1 Tax=Alteromonas sp. C1M14 TaxID=2841567 RepID=UPI001C0A2BAD|nr:HlyD family efflux transporter periplasmic adaptor subunit [Alteromonas sp. C1M14]MBU2977776.1 HlyD family efflux transporter periplasmic adaptor subunit [Alteromonas sp. C1M14]